MRRCNLWEGGGYFERAESKRAGRGQPAPLLLFNCQAGEVQRGLHANATY